MNKNILYLLGMPLLMGIFSSCEDHRQDYMEGSKVYITKSGIIEQSAYAVGTGETKLDLWASRSGLNEANGQVVFKVDAKLLDNYNTDKANEEHLELLPADCYRLPQTEFVLSSQNIYAPFELYYDIDKIASKYGYGRKYMLPISLESKNLTVNNDKNNIMLILNVMDPQIGFREFGSKAFDVKSTDISYKELLNIGVDFLNTLDVTLQMEVGSQEQVEYYNQKYGTNYQVLPPSCYTFFPESPVLQKGESDVTIECNIKAGSIPGGIYLLPVELISANPYNIINTNQIFYYIFNNESEWRTTSKDKENWQILNALSYNDGEDGKPTNIIDGNTSSKYWAINYADKSLFETIDGSESIPSYKPQWTIIDLGKEITIGGIKLHTRPGYTSAIMDMDIYVATEKPHESVNSPYLANTYTGSYDINEPIWKKAGGVTKFGGNGATELIFADPKPSRYIQIRIIKGLSNSCMGEIDILEMK